MATRPIQAEQPDVTVGIPTRNRSRLLHNAISSVLGQTYRRFRLVVSDNASDDDTAQVVASFRDPRLAYRPLAQDIGRVANTNRLIEHADTEFVVLLGDDDQLRPDHLAKTIDALRRWPSVGVSHTGCTIVDANDTPLVPHARLIKTRGELVFETGDEFIHRSMRTGWTVCFSSAAFRRAALVDGGGLRPEDGVIDDLPLLMRIATGWDFAYVNRPLAVMRAHTDASSSSLGSFTPDGFRTSRAVPDLLYERRRRFLAEANLPRPDAERLSRIAERMYRHDRLGHLSMRATTGDGHVKIFKALRNEIRSDRRLGLDPMTWRFVVGQLGARRVRNGARKILESRSDRGA